MKRRWAFASSWIALATLTGLVALWADEAWARPGGGHSYSGGSSSYSGGSSSSGSSGGGDGGALLYLLIRLIIDVPHIGIPLALVIGFVVIKAKMSNDGLGDWESGQSIAAVKPAVDLDAIRTVDPNFSYVRFTDFVYSLYAQGHRARHDEHALAKLAPYLSPQTRSALRQRPPVGGYVETVAIGSMRVSDLSVPQGQDGQFAVVVDFESNLITNAGGVRKNHYTHERWTLVRSGTALSRPPGSAQTFHCPNCAAPFESTDEATCSYCGEVVSAGRFDWSVAAVHLFVDEERLPRLAGHAVERGTRLETVFHPRLDRNFQALHADDPTVTVPAIGQRLQTVYSELNRGWSQSELAIARPFVSDGMADYLSYWLGAYRQQGLRNITENCIIERWELARVTRDNHYDALVIRIFAHSLDYTLDERGKVVGGSRSTPREYSEYWTLIRAAGVRRSPMDPSACPNCGAPLKISMGGNCEFCGAHVTNGEFDWVLSKIEQDEAYIG